jgi:hypothetical protein
VHGLALLGVGIWCFVVALLGGLLGLVLGNIRLPVLLLGANPAAAAVSSSASRSERQGFSGTSRRE